MEEKKGRKFNAGLRARYNKFMKKQKGEPYLSSHITVDVCQMEDFILEELDRAREEGYDDCFADLLYKYNVRGKEVFTKWLDEKLSKLTTK